MSTDFILTIRAKVSRRYRSSEVDSLQRGYRKAMCGVSLHAVHIQAADALQIQPVAYTYRIFDLLCLKHSKVDSV